jgi:hypothetical protein
MKLTDLKSWPYVWLLAIYPVLYLFSLNVAAWTLPRSARR